MTDPAPAVTGKPLRWLRLDGLVLLAASLILFASTHHPLTLALGLLWLAHIGMDRLARYGLKYDTGFQHTHLGGPGPVDPP